MQRSRRKLWTFTITTGATLLVAAALVTGLFRLAVQIAPAYKEDIAAYVSQFLNRPVAIEAMDLSWRGVRPTLVFSGVSLLAESAVTPVLELEELELGFSLLDLARGELSPRAINLVGAVLELERRADGKLFVHGLDANANDDGSALAQRLESLDRLQVSQSDLIWRDRKLGLPDYWFTAVDLRIRRGRDDALGIKLDVQMPKALQGQGALALQVRGDLSGGQWTATGELDIDGLTPGQWLDAWAGRDLNIAGEPVEAQAQFSLRAVPDEGLQIDGSGQLNTGAVWHDRPGQGIARLELQAEIDSNRSGRRIVVSELSVRSANPELPASRRDWQAERIAVQWQPQPGNGWQLAGDVSALELADVAHWQPVFWPDSASGLATARGRLRSVDWTAQRQQADGAVQYSAAGTVEQLALPSDGQRSGVTGLNAQFSLSESGGQASVAGAAVALQAPKHIPVPIRLDTLQAQADWSLSEQAWRVAIEGLQTQTLGAQIQGRVVVSQTGGQPRQLLVDTTLAAEDTAALKPLIPTRWPDKLSRWLNRALVKVPVRSGTLKIDGPLIGAPYHRVPGLFDLALELEDLTLDFAPKWPQLEGADASLRMNGPELVVNARGGRTAGVALGRTEANIPHLFDEPVLQLRTSSRSDAATLLGYIPQSPLAQRLSGITDALTVSGDSQLQLGIEVPLRVVSQTRVDGSVTFTGAQVEYTGAPHAFRDVLGTVAFTDTGASARQLKGLYDGRPLRLNITPVSGQPGLTELEFQTRIALDDAGHPWLAGLPNWALAGLQGASDWVLRTRVGGRPGAAGQDAGDLRLSSDLRGVTSSLPEPLDKTDAQQALPLIVRLSPGDDRWRATGNLAQRLAFSALLPRDGAQGNQQLQPSAVHLSLGSSTPPHVQPGFSANGVLPRLNLTAWQAVLPAAGQSGASRPGPNIALDVQLGELKLAKARLSQQRINGGRDNNAWSLALRGGAEGTLRWGGRRDDPIVLRLAELRLLEIKPSPDVEASDSETADAAPANEPVANPSAWPALDIDAQRVMLDRAEFGRVIVRTERRNNGASLRQLSVEGPMLNGQAEGYWVRAGGISRGGFEGAFSSPDIARVQDAFGLVRTVDAKQTRATVDLGWPESPAGLDWTQATGSIEINIDDGVLATVEPGAGRMVGLLSFNALPRRLLGDFRDVVDSGMKFDSISGHFRVGGGRADTDDLEVRAPSADISVKGSVGLAQRTYDQTITVQPDLSSGVTLAGTVFGGPAVGAILLVAQELFDKPLNQAGQVAYHLGGTWDDPVVTRPNQRAAEPDPPQPSDRGPRS